MRKDPGSKLVEEKHFCFKIKYLEKILNQMFPKYFLQYFYFIIFFRIILILNKYFALRSEKILGNKIMFIQVKILIFQLSQRKICRID